MACTDCTIARQQPEYRVFNPVCLWCGARYFQLLRQMPPIDGQDGFANRVETKDQRLAWIKRVLATWEKQGHDRARLRELGMAAVIPYEPVGARSADADDSASNGKRPQRKGALAGKGRARAQGAHDDGMDAGGQEGPGTAGDRDSDAPGPDKRAGRRQPGQRLQGRSRRNSEVARRE